LLKRIALLTETCARTGKDWLKQVGSKTLEAQETKLKEDAAMEVRKRDHRSLCQGSTADWCPAQAKIKAAMDAALDAERKADEGLL
jgi:hypothetical protein